MPQVDRLSLKPIAAQAVLLKGTASPADAFAGIGAVRAAFVSTSTFRLKRRSRVEGEQRKAHAK